MSRNREAYSVNQRSLFDEVYGLASTQALKVRCDFNNRFSLVLTLSACLVEQGHPRRRLEGRYPSRPRRQPPNLLLQVCRLDLRLAPSRTHSGRQGQDHRPLRQGGDRATPLFVSPTTLADSLSVRSQLFFGPDEGTANYMAWVADHARARGAPWWKASSTGKPASTHGGMCVPSCSLLPSQRKC